MRNNQPVTNQEYVVPEGLILVSKTDLQGTITECNDAFEAASGFSKNELIGEAHNLVRHPDVPEAVFKDMWETLKMGAPWTQMVKNRRADGGFYWVQANATPVYKDNQIVGYMSVRTAIGEADKRAATQAYQDIAAGKAKIKHGQVIYGFDWSRLNFYPKLNPQYQMTLMIGLLYLLPYLIYAETIGRGHMEVALVTILGLIPPYLYGLARLKADRKMRERLRRLAANDPMQTEQSDPTTYNGKMQSAFKSACLGAVERSEESAYQLDKANQLQSAIDQVSANVMIADSKLNIVYMNQTMTEFMRERENQLQNELPNLKANEILGSSIDIFHKNPEHNRAMLQQIKKPTVASIQVGGFHLELNIVPVFNRAGIQTSTLVEWRDCTAEFQLIDQVNSTVNAAKNGILTQRIDLSKVNGVARQLSQSINEMLVAIEKPINSAVQIAVALSSGDLTQQINGRYSGRFAVMQDSLNVAVNNLSSMMAQTKNTTIRVEEGAQQINTGSIELNERTQNQAASIEETAASMEQMTSAVKQNAENAQQAAQATQRSAEQAKQGVKVMDDAILSMQQINQSSQRINDIISLIDSIAFQTNLLALNAAVEAARAGEHGRGFAVVAGEVRNLAGKSSEAAKEIRQLIEDTVQKVSEGTQHVQGSGEALNQMVESITQVNQIIEEIAASSHEQSEGIIQVNQAITNIDSAVQQNAAMVEVTTSTAEELEKMAKIMIDNVSQFKMHELKGIPATGDDMSGFDFARARRAHTQWRVKLNAYVNDVDIEFDRKSATNPNLCELGKWMKDSGKRYQHLSSYQTLQSAHTQLHELIGNILEFKENKNEGALKQGLTELFQLSEKVVSELHQLEKELQQDSLSNQHKVAYLPGNEPKTSEQKSRPSGTLTKTQLAQNPAKPEPKVANSGLQPSQDEWAEF